MRGLKLALVGLSAAMLVSSCGTPSSPGSSGTAASTPSARYSLFGLEPFCPPTDCDAALIFGRGELSDQRSYLFNFNLVDRRPGPDLFEGEFHIATDVYLTEAGAATIATPLVDVAATLENVASSGDTIDVEVQFNMVTGEYDLTLDGVLYPNEEGGRSSFVEDRCDLIEPS